MNRIKWFTQRVTGLIVYPTICLLTPFVLAKIGQATGLWRIVDGTYTIAPLFWILFVVTRGAYAFLWILFYEWFVEKGKRLGFFWFKPERPSWSEESVDKSGEIVSWTATFVFALLVAEIAIRVTTWTLPPYLPPPAG